MMFLGHGKRIERDTLFVSGVGGWVARTLSRAFILFVPPATAPRPSFVEPPPPQEVINPRHTSALCYTMLGHVGCF